MNRHCARLFWIVIISIPLFSPSLKASQKPAWPPKFYGFCMELPAVPDPSIAEQAKMLKQLGFDGAGYALWLGEAMDTNLRTLDAQGQQLYLVYMTVNLDPNQPAFDARVPEALAKLKGRSVTVSVLFRGFSPGDPRGMKAAVKSLRQLGDLAAKSDLKISIYHHANDWTESLLFSLQVVRQVDHPKVGVNFNLCHWLKVDGGRDYHAVLRKNADRLFAVTINGAQVGAEAWTGGLIQPLDRGDFDNRALLGLLREIAYDGPIGLMCYGIPDDTRTHLQRSMRTWTSWHKKQP
jgi:sugar phosphate isomerase/epimerase